MKKLNLIILTLLVNFSLVVAQSPGDYRSRGNGNWKDASTWSRWNGSAWVNASSKPDYATNVTIHDEDVVTLTAPGSNQYNECANLTVQSGYLIGNEGLFVFGNISVSTNAQIGDASYPIIIISGETCEMSGWGGYYLGGIWKYEHWNASDNSTLTIASGTTVNYKGTVDQIFIKNDDADTRFNITVNGTINCATGTIGNNGYISFDGSNGAGGNSCGGSLTINAGGTVNAGQIYLMNNNSSSTYSTALNIAGRVNSRVFTFSNSGSAGGSLRIFNSGVLNIGVSGSYGATNNTVTLDNGSKVIYSYDNNQTVLALGNYYYLEMDGTNGPINRTLGGNISVNGKLTLKGTTNIVSGGYSLTYGSGASLEYIGTSHTTSNTEWPSTLDKNITIATSGKVTLNGSKSAYSGTVTFSSGEFDVASYTISGTGSFNMSGSTKINTKHVNGIGSTGNFQLSGTQTFSTAGSYEYNSTSESQYSGNLLPSAVANLILDNIDYGGKIYLTNSVTVNTLLTRKRGELNLNSNSLSYGVSAGLLYDNGTTELTAGDEFPSTMNGTVRFSGTGKIIMYSDRLLSNTLTVDAGSRLTLGADIIFTVTGNTTNNGTIDGDVRSKIYHGGNTFANGSSSLIDTDEFYFTKSGEQSLTGLNKFHSSLNTKINSGSIVNFGDNEVLFLDYGTLTILTGGRLNISGTVTINGEGNIYIFGLLYVNGLSTLLINGDNGVNTNAAITVNLYTSQINGSDGNIMFTGYNQILAHNQGSITGGSLGIVLESGELYLGPNTGPETIITINGGFSNTGGMFETSPSIIVFNSNFINYGTSKIYRMDFRGSAITNTGILEINNYLYFNNGGEQKVHGLTGISIGADAIVKGTTKLILDNSVATPEEQQLTLIGGSGGTFTVEANAQLEINGNVTFFGTEGCSSVPNHRCGTFIDYGQMTINSDGNFWLCMGWVKMLGPQIDGSGRIRIGQEMSNYCDVTDLIAGSLATSGIMFEVPTGCGVDIARTMFTTDGPSIISGIFKMTHPCDCPECEKPWGSAVFYGTTTISAGGGFGSAWLSCYDLEGCYDVRFYGSCINTSGTPISIGCYGNTQQSITGAFNDLTLDNPEGVLLTGNSSVINLTLTNGIINTGEYTLTVGTGTNNTGTVTKTSGYVIGKIKRWVNNVTAENILFPVGTSSYYRPANISFTGAPLNGGTILVQFTNLNPGTNGLPLEDNGVTIENIARDGYWGIITDDGLNGGTYDIDLTAAGFGGISDYSTLRILKRNTGGNWGASGVHSACTGSNSVPVLHRTGLTSFSEFGVGGAGDNPLPVEISSFSNSVQNRNVILKWQTQTEVNSYMFEIERRLSGVNGQEVWIKTGEVNASGNSNSPKNYSFTDYKLNTGSYEFRLKAVDTDGSFSYSHSVFAHVLAPMNFALGQNYPNPFNPSTIIEFSVPEISWVTLDVYNLSGEKISTLVSGYLDPGYHSAEFSPAEIASGIYFYRISALNSSGLKYVYTKKMILKK
ncbi:MAG: T9SS type A sorting domain-containing protein [Ignavibacteriaceae bacterium]|nr:T9SS type A sorting domain-containing protein [Ignavibacteriaceae bacterium]